MERFVERDASLATKKAGLRRDLEQNRQKIVNVEKEVANVEDRLADLPALEQKIKVFREAGIEERLKEKSLLISEERILRTARDRIKPFRDTNKALRAMLPIDDSFASPESLKELPGK